MTEFTENELWILPAAIEIFVQHQKDKGIHPDRIEETKALMRKLWDVTDGINRTQSVNTDVDL